MPKQRDCPYCLGTGVEPVLLVCLNCRGEKHVCVLCGKRAVECECVVPEYCSQCGKLVYACRCVHRT